MNKSAGFTLIELVVVIVILGILAAVAAPRFIDISSDARLSTLEGLRGAVKSGNNIVYAKAIVDEVQTNPTGTIDDIAVAYGEAVATSAALSTLLDENVSDWQFGNVTGTTIEIRPADIAADAGCFVTYTEATTTNRATIEVTDDTDC